MVESGSREGEELRRVWTSLKEEEQQAADWLRREVQENLSSQVTNVGGISCDGSTRGKISEERDKTWANLIVKSLENHPQQDQTKVFSCIFIHTSYLYVFITLYLCVIVLSF